MIDYRHNENFLFRTWKKQKINFERKKRKKRKAKQVPIMLKPMHMQNDGKQTQQ